MDMNIIVKGIMAAAALVYIANMHNKVSDLRDRIDTMQDDLNHAPAGLFNDIPIGFVEDTQERISKVEKIIKSLEDLDFHKKELKDHVGSELLKCYMKSNSSYDNDRKERERKLQEACDDFNSRIESIEKYLRENKTKKI